MATLTREQTLELMERVGNLANTVGLDDLEKLNVEISGILTEAMGAGPKNRFDFCGGVVEVTGLAWAAVLPHPNNVLVTICRDYFKDKPASSEPVKKKPVRTPKKSAEPPVAAPVETPVETSTVPTTPSVADIPEVPAAETAVPEELAKRTIRRKAMKEETTDVVRGNFEAGPVATPAPLDSAEEIIDRIKHLEMHMLKMTDLMSELHRKLNRFWELQRQMIKDEYYVPPKTLD